MSNNGQYAKLHNGGTPRVTLRQWRVLQAVVECGGFAEAAKKLRRSQSTISYAVSQLQEQVGTTLLKVEGRKARLTETGRVLLERSNHLLREALALEDLARQMERGWESQLHLAVDRTFPAEALMSALSEFALLPSAPQVHLQQISCMDAEKVLRARAADIVISSHIPRGFLGDPLTKVEYVAVVHPHHPMLRVQWELMPDDLERRTRIVVHELGDSAQEADAASPDGIWRVDSFDTALAALLKGLGYAWLPRHQIRELLQQGALVPLPLREGRVYSEVLQLAFGTTQNPGPGAVKLADFLRRASVEAYESCAEHSHSRVHSTTGSSEAELSNNPSL